MSHFQLDIEATKYLLYLILYLMMKIRCLSLLPLGKSDHIVIEFIYWCYYTIESRSVSKYLYNRGDYMSMTRELLNTDWEVLFEGLDTENM